MRWTPTLTELQNLLSELYASDDDRRRLVDQAGLPGTQIKFEGTSVTVWHAILTAAQAHGRLPELIAIARGEYGANARLAAQFDRIAGQLAAEEARNDPMPPGSQLSFGGSHELPTGQAQVFPSTSRRERVRIELGELHGRYENLTRRIAAVDTDLGRALDSEQGLILEERRAELASKRDEVNARMAQIEKELAEPASEQKAAAPPVDVAKGEAKAKPVMQIDPAPSQPAKPVEPAPPDRLTITTPLRLELVRVPAGKFLMGSDPAKDQEAFNNETPQHRLSLPEFYIGKFPVTNDQYAVFVQQAKSAAPENWPGGKIPSEKEQHPVVHVSWHDARAFCQWLSEATGESFRLASEAEWEKAARGVDGRLYPWGNQPPMGELCNFVGSKINDTAPVDRYPKGASPYGSLDMAGNVWEWTGSLWGKDGIKPRFGYPYNPSDGRENLQAADDIRRVVRGGSYLFTEKHVRCANRHRFDPRDRSAHLGFRVVSAQLIEAMHA